MSLAPKSEPAGLFHEEDVPHAGAAFTFDATAGAIVAANAEGWKAWGLDPANPAPPIAIDTAMPALRRLRAIAGEGWPEPERVESLVLWTALGTRQIACRIRSSPEHPGLLEVGILTATAQTQSRNAMPGERAAVPDDDGRAEPTALQSDPAGQMSDVTLRARLAHELRTPLSAVIAYAEILKDEHFGPLANERYRAYAANIYDSARHALGVADGMLRDAPKPCGMPQLTFADVDPARIVEQCLTVARPLAARAGLGLTAELPVCLPRIVADELSLRQMLLNLLTNAIKFARRGDRITVAVCYDGDGPLRISVSDTGPGMGAAAACADAGPARRRARMPNRGIGLGLPLTKTLAEANGAVLAIESTVGRGTCATISFGKDRVVHQW